MEPIILCGPTAKHFDFGQCGEVNCERFPSGESFCQIKENIRGKDTFIVQSICAPANNSLMDLLIMGDAARRASAGRLTGVLPFLGYMRADRKDKPRVPISAKLVIDMIECAGFDRIITMDVHTLQAQGFTNIPFDHLFSYPLIATYLRNQKSGKKTVFVSPDIGAIKRAQAYATAFGVGMAIVNKKRLSPDEVSAESLIGDVKDADVILTDDLTESCNTLIEAAKICRKYGAKSVKIAVTHYCVYQQGFYNLACAMNAGIIDECITTNTVNYVPEITCESEKQAIKKITILKVDDLFLKAINATNKNESITDLFEVKGF